MSDLLDLARDALVVLDAQGRITAYGRACEDLLGWTAAEVLGRPFAMLFDTPEIIDPPLERFSGGGLFPLSARHRREGPLNVFLGLVTRDGPTGRRFIAVLHHDPTATAGERAGAGPRGGRDPLDDLAAPRHLGSMLAHELSQPLTAATLYLQAAERMLDPRSGAATLVGKARREADRAGRIIRGLRRLAERRPPDRVPVALEPLADEAIELALVGFHPRPVVERLPGNAETMVLAEAVQVQQIIVNLVRNACDAVARLPEPRLWVTTHSNGHNGTLSVRDNGPGIAPAAMADLFSPFRTAKTTGLGLGLALSRAIAEQFGGRIVVDPGGASVGATMSLVLPLARPAAP